MVVVDLGIGRANKARQFESVFAVSMEADVVQSILFNLMDFADRGSEAIYE